MKRNILISTPARRYAKALLEAAIKQRAFSFVLDELESFHNLLRDSSLLQTLFLSPAISSAKKKKVLEDLSKKTNYQQLTINFLTTLIHRGRLGILDQAIVSAEQQFLERQGIIVVEVMTARVLSEKENDDLMKELETFTGKKVQIENTVNPKLIGGIITRIGTTVYDGSVLAQLEQMKAKIMQ